MVVRLVVAGGQKAHALPSVRNSAIFENTYLFRKSLICSGLLTQTWFAVSVLEISFSTFLKWNHFVCDADWTVLIYFRRYLLSNTLNRHFISAVVFIRVRILVSHWAKA